MPIRPDLKPLYPDDWDEIRTAILKRAGDCCEFCGVHDRYWGYRDESAQFHKAPWGLTTTSAHQSYFDAMLAIDAKEFQIILTIAHLDHDVENNSLQNLAALCCQCHNRHDGAHRARNRSKTRDRKRGQRRFWDDP